MRSAGTFLRRHRRLSLASVLGAPAAWMIVIYAGSLFLMIVSAFFSIDDFTQEPTSDFTTENIRDALTSSAGATGPWCCARRSPCSPTSAA